MEKSPFQQPKQEKIIDFFIEDAKNGFGEIFDDKRVQQGLDDMILLLDKIPDDKIANKEAVILGLRESVNIKNRNDFINYILKIIEPIHTFSINNPRLFEDLQREHYLTSEGNTKLSELLFCGFDEKEKRAHIHLVPARIFIKEEGANIFIREIKNGLYNLAEILNYKEEIEKITATSWIVKDHPDLIKNMGFIITKKKLGLSSLNYKRKSEGDSFMDRKDFLLKYGTRKS